MRIRPKALVALAAAGACSLLMATPASAAPFSVEINSGTLVLEETLFMNSDTIDLTPSGGTSPCAPANISLEFPTSSTARINTFSTEGHFELSGGGTTYQVNLSVANAPVSGTVGSGIVAVHGVDFAADIYEDNDLDCNVDVGVDDLICDFRVTVDLDGTYNGNPASPASGDLFSLDVTTPGALGVNSVCNAPFATYSENSIVHTDPGLDGAPIELEIV